MPKLKDKLFVEYFNQHSSTIKLDYHLCNIIVSKQIVQGSELVVFSLEAAIEL